MLQLSLVPSSNCLGKLIILFAFVLFFSFLMMSDSLSSRLLSTALFFLESFLFLTALRYTVLLALSLPFVAETLISSPSLLLFRVIPLRLSLLPLMLTAFLDPNTNDIMLIPTEIDITKIKSLFFLRQNLVNSNP